MDNFKIRTNQLIFNVFPSLSNAKRTKKCELYKLLHLHKLVPRRKYQWHFSGFI